MSNARFAPDFRVAINQSPVPGEMRASISSVNYQTGLDGADRVELTLVNDGLRWLGHPLLRLDNEVALSIGYAPDPLRQVFVGQIVGQSATFPASGSPMVTVAAQDRRSHLQQSTSVRWFAIPEKCMGNWPMPDQAVASIVSIAKGLIPIFDPIGAAIAVVIGGVEVAVADGSPDAMQKLIRKQTGESDFEFLGRISRENGWEMVMDHSGTFAGHQLRFMSLASELEPEVTLKYGRNLIEFSPRISTVGQIAGVSARFWKAESKMEFTVTVTWDWDRSSLNISIDPGFGMSTLAKPESKPYDGTIMLVEEPVNQFSAPRALLSRLLTRLNQRLTASGSTVGDPRIRAGQVLAFEGVGPFNGRYRVTSANHSIDGGGYRTTFEVRKEMRFGSLPWTESGARVTFQGESLVTV